MKVISKSRTSGDVNTALYEALVQMNKDLKNVAGVITKLGCEISVRPSGAYVSLTTVINGEQQSHKEIFGVNIRRVNRERSISNATEELNGLLKDKNGDIVDIYSKTAAALPGRFYTTMIAAINERAKEPAVKDAIGRRERIKKTLELLNNAPAAINIARVAEVFGVSRSMIYRDLEVLGFDRGNEAEK
jgi:hypothetical protein